MTTFGPLFSRKGKGRIRDFYEIWNPTRAFLTQNRVKSGQNRQKIKKSENWEKIHFFDTLTTFVALEPDSPAPIEKKMDLAFFHFSVTKNRGVRGVGFKNHAQLFVKFAKQKITILFVLL